MVYSRRKRISKRYLSSISSLWGSSDDRAVGRPKKPPKKPVEAINVLTPTKVAPRKRSAREEALKDIPSESMEQVRFVRWLDFKKVLFTASANGGLRSQWEGAKLKNQGVKPGYPDIDIKMARKGYHGLLIELKRTQGGSVSQLQAWWIKRLNEEGYLAVVCEGADAAIKVVENYLG